MMIQERVDAWGRVNKMALDNPLVCDLFVYKTVKYAFRLVGGKGSSLAIESFSRTIFFFFKCDKTIWSPSPISLALLAEPIKIVGTYTEQTVFKETHAISVRR